MAVCDEETNTLVPILLVEDSLADAKLMQHAFKKAKIPNPITHIEDGQDAWDYIMSEGQYADDATANPSPAIILLDLNMPGMDGRALLAKLKSEQIAKRIPIIVITTSDNPDDVNGCYDSGANAYIKKPTGSKKLYDIIKTLEQHWLRDALLPER